MKTSLLRTFLFIALIMFLVATISFAQIPKLINYQGVLTDAGGNAVQDGIYELTFRQYDLKRGGTAIWTEVQSEVAVSKGIFNVNLGSVNPLELPFDRPYWLGVTIGNGTELVPRIQLTNAGYSFRSSFTESIEGITAGGDLTGTFPYPSINDGAITSSKLAPGVVITSLNGLTDAVTLTAGSNISIDRSENTITISANTGEGSGDITSVIAGNGLLGGGESGDVTLNVAIPLLLSGNSSSSIINCTNIGSGNAVYGFSQTGNGLFGESQDGRGVYGYCLNGIAVNGNSFSNAGVKGISNYGDGVQGYTASGNNGVFGQSDKSDGHGVYGLSTSGIDGDGVLGISAGSAIGDGVHGSSNTGNGVYGISSTGVGVYGASDYGTAVYGYSPETGYAGGFEGYVRIMGHLIVTGSKAFKIDHPLDPANKYLVHFCMESDEVLNNYSGNITLDEKGEGWIKLPDYFETLNKDFRYQLTAIGFPGPNLYIAQEISGNRFKIAGGNSGMKVSWQVIGVRNDPYLKVNPTQSELEKTGVERGKYIHPKEYGVSETLGIDYENTRRMKEKIKTNAPKSYNNAK